MSTIDQDSSPSRLGRGGEERTGVGNLALAFLKLGTIAFGGPAAHIAMMRKEFVDRRGWLTEADFLDLVGMANLIPGPSSTEVAIFIGYRRAGVLGLLIAGLCFILPAALIVLTLAAGYRTYGHLPIGQGILYGIKPVIIAIVVQALWTLGRQAVKSTTLGVIGAVALIAVAGGLPPLTVVLAGGLAALLIAGRAPDQPRRSVTGILGFAIVIAAISLMGLLLQPSPAWHNKTLSLLIVFVKIGSVVYGSGYVLLAYLKTDLVTRLHWLTSTQLLDAVAVGQFTPGPVFTTATFIGYLIGGVPGAIVATLGIFLPAFLFVGIARRGIGRLRESPSTSAFLDGVNVASLALMTAVSWQLSRTAVVDVATAVVALSSAFILFRYRLNSMWLLASGAIVGLIKISMVH